MKLALLAALTLLVPSATAQSIDWLSLERDDSRVQANPALGLSDTEEKDFAWGDFDRDGWTDLVVVRKEINLGEGKRRNVLLMNEGGVLTDRTALYATASSVPGDQGLMQPTADRDVIAVDVDGDGWLDLVTAASVSAQDPKFLSHPRVYRNLGGSPGGVWNGFRFEADRMPQLLVNGQPASPNFCGVGAGDVDGDGDVDLFFSDYSFVNTPDLDDRLLINDGRGYFTDESTQRMSADMLQSGFGTHAVIQDMNGDGKADVIKDMGTCACTEVVGNFIRVLYNDPDQEGQFEFNQTVQTGVPYFFSVGDLNQDELPDLVIANDNAPHRYRLNQGNNFFGMVDWGPDAVLKQGAGSSNLGSGGNTIIADLDMDGWNEAIVCDFEVSVGSCLAGRGTMLFHHRGGTPGGAIELQQEQGGGFRGALGLDDADLLGVHDVAVFDLDLDGDPDLVFGTCDGLRVWINGLVSGAPLGVSYCESNPNSGGTPAVLVAAGSPLVADNEIALQASSVPAGTFGYFILSDSSANLPGFGGSQGVLCLGSPLVRFVDDVLQATEAGRMDFTPNLTQLPQGTVIQSGESWNFQLWYRDVNPVATSNTTNGLRIDLE